MRGEEISWSPNDFPERVYENSTLTKILQTIAQNEINVAIYIATDLIPFYNHHGWAKFDQSHRDAFKKAVKNLGYRVVYLSQPKCTPMIPMVIYPRGNREIQVDLGGSRYLFNHDAPTTVLCLERSPGTLCDNNVDE